MLAIARSPGVRTSMSSIAVPSSSIAFSSGADSCRMGIRDHVTDARPAATSQRLWLGLLNRSALRGGETPRPRVVGEHVCVPAVERELGSGNLNAHGGASQYHA